MDARTVSQAAIDLASLRRLALERLAVSLGAALVAAPAAFLSVRLGVAVGAGALVEGVLALTSSAQRRSLVESLGLRRDAYLLPEVRRYGEALSTMESRRALARSIAGLLRYASTPGALPELADRLTWQAPALTALAQALCEPANVVEPTAAVACAQLLKSSRTSPLLNLAIPRAELDRALRRIHAGISPRPQAHAPASAGDCEQAA